MSDFWVFGYGSLMWQPGFEHEQAVAARLNGLHRSLCIYSWVHRGTQQRPGLVLGLDRGGSCRGIAYRVAGERRDAVLRYLRERELVTDVYLEVVRPVHLEGHTAPVDAVTYIADRTHEQYAGNLPRETLLTMVKAGVGKSGNNVDYVIATVRHMLSVGIRDATLEWLAAELGGEGGDGGRR
ncbi:MAG TPA: gamma-glutamylcyclotransferase [Bauldia sp.]|nr:gamma-glutamylcyclotransferase [Bauldia sp.]